MACRFSPITDHLIWLPYLLIKTKVLISLWDWRSVEHAVFTWFAHMHLRASGFDKYVVYAQANLGILQ